MGAKLIHKPVSLDRGYPIGCAGSISVGLNAPKGLATATFCRYVKKIVNVYPQTYPQELDLSAALNWDGVQ